MNQFLSASPEYDEELECYVLLVPVGEWFWPIYGDTYDGCLEAYFQYSARKAHNTESDLWESRMTQDTEGALAAREEFEYKGRPD